MGRFDMGTMGIPYGFDCYAFQKDEIKYFDRDILRVKQSVLPRAKTTATSTKTMAEQRANGTARGESKSFDATAGSSSASEEMPDLGLGVGDLVDHVRFTRKNEDYPREQVLALGLENRLNLSEIDKRIFCGIKIQLGIGVVTSFLRKGLQYKQPIRGRSEMINGSWTGIMKGLTVAKESPLSYDIAFGNFLAWDEEFPYIKFGPFFAIESKLVMLTGSSRRVEASSFGTNITRDIWLSILTLLLVLSILATLRIHWQKMRHLDLLAALRQLSAKSDPKLRQDNLLEPLSCGKQPASILQMLQNFFFIYITMLLNKPSLEFDELIWPRVERHQRHCLKPQPISSPLFVTVTESRPLKARSSDRERLHNLLEFQDNELAKQQYDQIMKWRAKRKAGRCTLPTSIRVLSYMWSAACLVIASIYSGEMLAVMLLHVDANVDTIAQLINSKPPIEPVIRQDDFTYNLMLKSLDDNMLKLHSKTRTVPRQEVYTRQFIEGVSQRKFALLGDDELIETIYDLYHKYYPLHKSKMSYLQYPISIMYRRDLNSTLETKLRLGLVQMFEMGLVHRWYQAQKDTYIQFYDTYERKADEKGANKSPATPTKTSSLDGSSDQTHNYKPLSLSQFKSFFRAMFYCIVFAFVVFLMELIHYKIQH